LSLTLYPHQQECVDATFKYLREHRDANPLLVVPTGAGKSLIAAHIIRHAVHARPSTRVVVSADRKELVEQNYAEFIGYAPELARAAGIVHADLGRREYTKPIVFAGIQTAYRNADRLGVRHLFIPDEAHTISRKQDSMYGQALSTLRTANAGMRVIGLTATPYRLDTGLLTEGDDALFTSVAYEADMISLFNAGILCPLINPPRDISYDVSGVERRGGEFVPSSLAKAVEEQRAVTLAALDDACDVARDRRSWLVFCASVAQAEDVGEILRQRGKRVAVVTGQTKRKDREAAVSDFRSRRIDVLVNVGVYTTGFNAKNVDCIICLRSTESPGLVVQMLGRGLRLHPDKENTLVLDYARLIETHGPINAIRPPRRRGVGGGEAPRKTCPACYYADVPASSLSCEMCGHEFPPPDKTKKMTTRASVQPVIDADAGEGLFHVDFVTYSRHSKTGKPDSVRVEYYSGMKKIACEWVCLDHGGDVQKYARSWVKRRLKGLSVDDVPNEYTMTTDELLDVVHRGWLLEPTKIKVDDDGKFSRVRGYVFGVDAEEKRDEILARSEKYVDTTFATGDLADDTIPF
jgi:DNA repair protein RadD